MWRDDHDIHYDFDNSRCSKGDARIFEKFLANNVACQNQVVDKSHDCCSVLSFVSVPNCFLLSFQELVCIAFVASVLILINNLSIILVSSHPSSRQICFGKPMQQQLNDTSKI
jgi:hypothetical protein